VCTEVLADILRINKSITRLNISWNKIDNDDVKAMADALLDNHTMTYINMRNNEITDIGGQAMIHALESNDTLLHLDTINGNKLSLSILKKFRSIRRNLNIT